MAGASMNDIKARIKSVQSTMQITKAMELVATSKLRRAKERVEKTRPYQEVLAKAIGDIVRSSDALESPYFEKKEGGKTLFIVIAGDRGLAGGYISNIFKLTSYISKNESPVYLPIGRKALEYYRHRSAEIYLDSFEYVAPLGVGDLISLGKTVCEGYLRGDYCRVMVVYTKFVSMMTQTATYQQLLPLENTSAEDKEYAPEFDTAPEALLEKIVPEDIGGILYSATCEALASESGSRRSAMNAANKNAGEMIDTLMLRFNRARQAVITQEITEIVSGAEAL